MSARDELQSRREWIVSGIEFISESLTSINHAYLFFYHKIMIKHTDWKTGIFTVSMKQNKLNRVLLL